MLPSSSTRVISGSDRMVTFTAAIQSLQTNHQLITHENENELSEMLGRFFPRVAVAYIKKEAVIPRYQRMKCVDVEGPCVIFLGYTSLEMLQDGRRLNGVQPTKCRTQSRSSGNWAYLVAAAAATASEVGRSSTTRAPVGSMFMA